MRDWFTLKCTKNARFLSVKKNDTSLDYQKDVNMFLPCKDVRGTWTFRETGAPQLWNSVLFEYCSARALIGDFARLESPFLVTMAHMSLHPKFFARSEPIFPKASRALCFIWKVPSSYTHIKIHYNYVSSIQINIYNKAQIFIVRIFITAYMITVKERKQIIRTYVLS